MMLLSGLGAFGSNYNIEKTCPYFDEGNRDLPVVCWPTPTTARDHNGIILSLTSLASFFYF